MRQQLVLAMRAKADAVMTLVRGGKSMDEAAAGVGAHVTRQAGMQLLQAGQYKTLGREFLTAIFSHKPGEVFAAGASDGVFIARLDAVRPGDVTATARLLEAIRPRASQDYLGDLIDATKTAARQSIKVTVNLDLARKTMGVDPAAKGAGGAP
jgi:hypothetical protein